METVRLLPVKVVAASLGIGKTLADELIAAGRIPAVRIGTKILVRETDLAEFVSGLEHIRPESRAS